MVTWDEAEKIFREAEEHLPVKTRFEAWSQSQREAYLTWGASLKRQLLFFPTGEGKTKTALALIASRGHKNVMVIAPTAAHAGWIRDGNRLGMNIVVHTFNRFRMPETSYKDKKDWAWIVDEFHMLGSHSAAGFKKFSRMMGSWNGDLIMCSATPNYNDAERVFCLTSIGDEIPNRNYIDWLWDNCNCHPSRWSMIPDVDTHRPFKRFDSAIDFLRSRPWVSYIEDKATWDEVTLYLPAPMNFLFELYNVNKREQKVMNSEMEKRHARVSHRFIDDHGRFRQEVLNAVSKELSKYPDRKKWMIFCFHKDVAKALYKTVTDNTFLIDGDATAAGRVEPIKQQFIEAEGGWLIGTTAIATGMDGVDKVCTSMLILDDFEGDDALRRQLIGRILPRGVGDSRPRLVVKATF